MTDPVPDMGTILHGIVAGKSLIYAGLACAVRRQIYFKANGRPHRGGALVSFSLPTTATIIITPLPFPKANGVYLYEIILLFVCQLNLDIMNV